MQMTYQDMPSSNSILVISPYWAHGTWVFDDPLKGLVQEPFVAGVPDMIDLIIGDIPNARNGFTMYFSASPFPGFQKKINWVREESGGNWYSLDEPEMEGWLCPAMFKYFDQAPGSLYLMAEALKE
jgi:hypothetical protein